MNTRNKNVTPYDPGRFRYSLTFFEEQNTTTADGSQIVTPVQLITTRAVREPIVKRMNFQGDTSLEAGATILQNDWNFVIRWRSSFTPKKDMIVSVAGDGVYTVRAIIEVDEPINFWRILCVKTDYNLTT